MFPFLLLLPTFLPASFYFLPVSPLPYQLRNWARTARESVHVAETQTLRRGLDELLSWPPTPHILPLFLRLPKMFPSSEEALKSTGRRWHKYRISQLPAGSRVPPVYKHCYVCVCVQLHFLSSSRSEIRRVAWRWTGCCRVIRENRVNIARTDLSISWITFWIPELSGFEGLILIQVSFPIQPPKKTNLKALLNNDRVLIFHLISGIRKLDAFFVLEMFRKSPVERISIISLIESNSEVQRSELLLHRTTVPFFPSCFCFPSRHLFPRFFPPVWLSRNHLFLSFILSLFLPISFHKKRLEREREAPPLDTRGESVSLCVSYLSPPIYIEQMCSHPFGSSLPLSPSPASPPRLPKTAPPSHGQLDAFSPFPHLFFALLVLHPLRFPDRLSMLLRSL